MEAIAYDRSGNRVERNVGGSVRTVYVYDAFGVLAAEYAPARFRKPKTKSPAAEAATAEGLSALTSEDEEDDEPL